MANEPQTILGKLVAQNPRKLQQRHGKIPSRSNSKTKQTFTKGEQIDQHKNKMQQLKQSKKRNTPSNIENAETTHRQNKVHAASKSEG